MKLLHVDSSILGDHSVTRPLTAEIVSAARATKPAIEVTYLDLAATPLAHLSGGHLAAFQGTAPESAALVSDIEAGQKALADFLAADIIVVGAPMYNFSIPSQLKSWIDRLAVAGQTFKYTENGPVGLAGGKTVIIASGRGGLYTPGNPGAAFDHQETYLSAVFGFFGITDVRFVRAEGVAAGGAEGRDAAIAAAKAMIAAAIA